MVTASTRRPRRITIQQPTASSTSFGADAKPTYEDLIELWVIEWRTLTGKELQLAQQTKGQATASITVRFQPSTPILAGYRVKYVANDTTRYFDINAAINLNEQDQYLQLLVTEAT